MIIICIKLLQNLFQTLNFLKRQMHDILRGKLAYANIVLCLFLCFLMLLLLILLLLLLLLSMLLLLLLFLHLWSRIIFVWIVYCIWNVGVKQKIIRVNMAIKTAVEICGHCSVNGLRSYECYLSNSERKAWMGCKLTSVIHFWCSHF